jgi:hypothetical protein
MQKNENFQAIISVTALQNYVYFGNRDQRILNSLDMVLIIKSETKVGGLHRTKKFFFRILTEKPLLHCVSLTMM